MTSKSWLIILILLLSTALTACDPVPTEADKQAKMDARIEAEAEKQYVNFEQLLSAGRADLALNIADHVLKSYPKTSAAEKFRVKVEPLRAQIEAERETRRLDGLWVYHDDMDEEAGGQVRTAYIFSKAPLGPAVAGKQAPRARLVLRRHPQWGDDVYLLSERGPFTCGSPCQLQVQFDEGETRTVTGEIPETGEHAIFVKDFTYFVQNLPNASNVKFDVSLEDGGTQSVIFEVGGYEPSTIGND